MLISNSGIEVSITNNVSQRDLRRDVMRKIIVEPGLAVPDFFKRLGFFNLHSALKLLQAYSK